MHFTKKAERISNTLYTKLLQHYEKNTKNEPSLIDFTVPDSQSDTYKNIYEAVLQTHPPSNSVHQPSIRGISSLRKAVASWYKKHYQVDIDYESEVLILSGMGEGTALISQTSLEIGDVALLSDPASPECLANIIAAEAISYPIDMNMEYQRLSEDIPAEVSAMSRLFLIDSADTPIGLRLDPSLLSMIFTYSIEHNLTLCHRASMITSLPADDLPMSILTNKDANLVAVELHTINETFGLHECPLAFVVGNKNMITQLTAMKANMGIHVPIKTQLAGLHLLNNIESCNAAVHEKTWHSTEKTVSALENIGFSVAVTNPLYLWIKLPEGYKDSFEFVCTLFEAAKVALRPGIVYGKHGEGYVRISLVNNYDQRAEGIERIAEFLKTSSPDGYK